MSDAEGHDPLRPEDLPGPDAEWADIRMFALTFDGYGHARSLRPGRDVNVTCNRLARAVRAALMAPEADPTGFTIDDLRAALFWEQRVVSRSWDGVPSAEILGHCRRLTECMRRRLQA